MNFLCLSSNFSYFRFALSRGVDVSLGFEGLEKLIVVIIL